MAFLFIGGFPLKYQTHTYVYSTHIYSINNRVTICWSQQIELIPMQFGSFVE